MSHADQSSDEALFQRGLRESEQFWRRFGAETDFSGKGVLDLGCGRGALTFDLAARGARKVVGADVDPERIEFAESKLRTDYARFAGRVSFRCRDLKDFPPGETFDVIVSKDAFEHLEDVGGTLAEMRARLVAGGRALIGFGPLYRSPFGDHGWTFAGFPWGHLLLPQSVLFRRIRRRHGWTPGSIQETGLNAWPLARFERAFRESGLRVASLTMNRGRHPLYPLLRPFSTIPVLREYFTFNIYCILERK